MRTAAALLLAALLFPGPARAGEGVLEGLEREIREIVEAAGPAVVKVTAEIEESATAGQEPEEPKPGALRFRPGAPFLTRSSRVGTGFLVSADGLVITSSQVAEGAGRARVTFPGGAIREGVVLGSDDFFQIALVKVDPVPDVAPLLLVTGDAPAPGSLGVFLGTSFGRTRNISLGIVTGRHLSGAPFMAFDNYLSVNLPVHPGDAGGPLLDRRGRVLGMGVGPLPTSFGFVVGGPSGAEIQGFPGTAGTAHVVPAADLRFAMEEIREHGKVRRSVLGIVLRTQSLEIRDVRPDSAAAEAGLAPGDVVIEVGGEPVEDAARFSRSLRRSPVGAPLALAVRRGEARLDLTARLTELVPGREPLVAGIAITSINGRVVLASVTGRLVDAGVRAGDQVVAIDGQEVKDAETVLRILLAAKDGTPIRLTLERRGAPVEVVVAD